MAKLFKLMDTDNGGSVSFKELALALNQLGLGTAEEKLAYAFDMYDQNGDGKLDAKEIEYIVNQMTQIAHATGGVMAQNTKEFNASIMKRLDENGDGVVDRNEFINKGASSPSLLALLGVRKL